MMDRIPGGERTGHRRCSGAFLPISVYGVIAVWASGSSGGLKEAPAYHTKADRS